MTANRRIFLNIVATYGRSLVALVCGLLGGRWVLESLGAEAYGVYAVVGVIITLMSVLNNLTAGSFSRFFAVSVGKCEAAPEEGLLECRRWFNVAVLIHTVLPVGLLVIGAPFGYWAIGHYFVIPAQYVKTSYWVFSCALVISFVSMVTVPFRALYTAKQEIAEMTLYTLFSTLAGFACAYTLLSYTGNKLFYHATYTMIIAVIPNLMLSYGAVKKFPECMFNRKWMLDFMKIRQVFAYTGWITTGSIAMTVQQQGVVTMVNKYLGLEYNTTNNIAGTLSGQASTLSSALASAFSPAIQNAAGAGKYERYVSLVVRSCKFGAILSLVFVVPMMFEIKYVVNLWLVTPPPMVVNLCVFFLINIVLERLFGGFLPAIHAYGRIMIHEVSNGIVWLVSLILAWYLICVRHVGIISVGWVSVFVSVLLSIIRLALWKWQLGYPIMGWLTKCFIPVIIISLISGAVGFIIKQALDESFLRVVVLTLAVVPTIFLTSWLFAFDSDERQSILSRIAKRK